MLIHFKKKVGVEIGRSVVTYRYGIRWWVGWIKDAPEGTVEWRHYGEWNFPRLPRFIWSNGRLVGIGIFGRVRFFR